MADSLPGGEADGPRPRLPDQAAKADTRGQVVVHENACQASGQMEAADSRGSAVAAFLGLVIGHPAAWT